jgi:hypothetical protein
MNKTSLVAGIGLCCLSVGAHATVLEAFNTRVEIYTIDTVGSFGLGGVFIDEDEVRVLGLDGKGNLDVSVTGTYESGDGTEISGTAIQNENGISALTYESLTVDGTDSRFATELSTVVTYEIRNTGSQAELVEFDYSLSNIRARLENGGSDSNPFADATTPGASNDAGIALRYRIRQAPDSLAGDATAADSLFDIGGTDLRYGADIEAWKRYVDGDVGFEFQSASVRGWSPIVTPLKFEGFTYGFEINIADQVGTLNLGILEPGDFTLVTVGMQIEALAADKEPFLFATMNDPVGARIRSTPVSTDPAPIPLPAGGWLLLSALFGVAALKERKARKRGRFAADI